MPFAPKKKQEEPTEPTYGQERALEVIRQVIADLNVKVLHAKSLGCPDSWIKAATGGLFQHPK